MTNICTHCCVLTVLSNGKEKALRSASDSRLDIDEWPLSF